MGEEAFSSRQTVDWSFPFCKKGNTGSEHEDLVVSTSYQQCKGAKPRHVLLQTDVSLDATEDVES